MVEKNIWKRHVSGIITIVVSVMMLAAAISGTIRYESGEGSWALASMILLWVAFVALMTSGIINLVSVSRANKKMSQGK